MGLYSRLGLHSSRHSIYAYKVNGLFLFKFLSLRDGLIIKKVQNSIYLVIECPLSTLSNRDVGGYQILDGHIISET